MQAKYRYLTLDEAVTLYYLGLRTGVQYKNPLDPDHDWAQDHYFCPPLDLNIDSGILYRLVLSEDEDASEFQASTQST